MILNNRNVFPYGSGNHKPQGVFGELEVVALQCWDVARSQRAFSRSEVPDVQQWGRQHPHRQCSLGGHPASQTHSVQCSPLLLLIPPKVSQNATESDVMVNMRVSAILLFLQGYNA